MSKRLYPHNRIRYWCCYDVEDICTTFNDIGLHPQTVRKWIKNGLRTIDKGKPALVYGNDLITYLKNNNSKNKCKTEFKEMYCMRCQDARPTYKNTISVEQKSNTLKVQGVCQKCKCRMFKSYKMDHFSRLKNQFKLVGVLELYDPNASADKTQFQNQERNILNESLQGELF